jgi:hypothetical protein
MNYFERAKEIENRRAEIWEKRLTWMRRHVPFFIKSEAWFLSKFLPYFLDLMALCFALLSLRCLALFVLDRAPYKLFGVVGYCVLAIIFYGRTRKRILSTLNWNLPREISMWGLCLLTLIASIGLIPTDRESALKMKQIAEDREEKRIEANRRDHEQSIVERPIINQNNSNGEINATSQDATIVSLRDIQLGIGAGNKREVKTTGYGIYSNGRLIISDSLDSMSSTAVNIDNLSREEHEMIMERCGSFSSNCYISVQGSIHEEEIFATQVD